MVDSETGLPVGTILGDVIVSIASPNFPALTHFIQVGRHPALLPTDMRKVRAVAVPLLQKFTGIVFCPTKGKLSFANICAGGGK
jgi:hypothetical protein